MLGLSLSMALGSQRNGAAAPPLPLQVVTTRGEIMTSEASARTASNNVNFARTRHYIGSVDVTELRIVWPGYWVDTTGEKNASSSHIIRTNVEFNGMSIRANYNGQRDGTVTPGDPFYISDPVKASDFGLETFPAGAEIWIRAERQYAVGGLPMFHQTTGYTTPLVDERYVSGGAGLTTSQLDNTGLVVAGSGGWTAQTHVWLPLCIIGRPVAPMMAVAVLGASIENGVGDNTGDGSNNGGGYMRRALINVSGKKIARVNLAKSGETAKLFVQSNAKRAAALPYMNHGFLGYGGNDYSTGETWADTLANLTQSWAIVKAAGVDYVEQYALSPKTTSTDSFATVANQTPRAGYTIDGEWFGTGNATLAAAVATNPNLDGFVSLASSQVDATFTDRWKAPPQPTADGIHPNPVIHTAMAALNVAHIEALRASYE